MSTAAIVTGLVLLGVGGGALAYALTSGSSSDDKKKTTPPPTPDPTKQKPAPPPGKWGRVMAVQQGTTRVYSIPAGTTFALAMDDGAAARTLIAGFSAASQGAGGAAWSVIEPTKQRPADWPTDDDEGPLVLRAEGAIPFVATLPEGGAVRAVWQWVPLVAQPPVGGLSPSPLHQLLGNIVRA